MWTYSNLSRMMQRAPDSFLQRAFSYTLVGDGVGSVTTSVTFNLPIDVNAPFVWCKTTYWTDLSGAAQTDSTRVIPAVFLQVTASPSQQPFFDVPTPIASLAGIEGLPQVLETPFLFNAGTNINSVFTNFSAASTYTRLRVTLIGYQVFQVGPLPQMTDLAVAAAS